MNSGVKHQNISAVLVNFGLPHIDGYKPRQNYQQRLDQAVLEHIHGSSGELERFAQSPVLNPDSLPSTNFDQLSRLVEDPPEPRLAPSSHFNEPRARRMDFAQLDADNRRLGWLGEEWALEFERRRLHDREHRPDLAQRLVWVSDVEGDGLGFDIQSFNADESPRLIEVKTTGLGKFFPFRVSSNEVRVSERRPESFYLYRVFKFSSDPRLYTLHGALSSVCQLEATQYSARVTAG